MIKYKSGFRHQLHEDAYTDTDIRVETAIITTYIELYPGGRLWCRKGYAWDGPSGPCRWIADRLPKWLKKKYLKTILPGSLFHDGLCQLMRMELLHGKWLHQANLEFRRVNIESKMSKPRVWWTFKAVDKCGSFAADPKNLKLVLTAP